MSPWNWTPPPSNGIWRHGSPWLKPLVALSPWLTVLLLLIMLWLTGDFYTRAKGVLFELPEGPETDGDRANLVALIMPMESKVLVFFDDARYVLGEETSCEGLVSHLTERVREGGGETLLALADKRLKGEDLFRFMALAKSSGLKKVLFAEKEPAVTE